jgi:hypothetical protein
MWPFSKTVPARKWTDAVASLHNGMKKYRARWFSEFVGHVIPLDIGLRCRDLTQHIEDSIGILQLCVAATTVRENAYVRLKDFDFFIELICISITSKRIDQLDSQIFELLAAPDPKIATQKWSLMVLPLVAETKHNQKLAKILAEWAMLLVLQARIQTCEACFDRKGADAVRAILKS